MRLSAPRVAPLAATARLTDEQREALAAPMARAAAQVLNIFRTLARAPKAL